MGIIRAMSEKLPNYIDPVYSAQHHKHFVGRVNLGKFPRLAGQLMNADQDVEVDILFFIDTVLKQPVFEMQLNTAFTLECQRSLNSFDLPIHAKVKGVFVESMALAEDYPSDLDVFELEEGNLSLYDLIEEELLLNIPMVPMSDQYEMNYQNQDAPELDQAVEEEKTNPFAALKGLKTH